MQSLALLEYGEIRVTEDNQFSVFDTIEVVGGKRSPREVWKRLSKDFPEVVTKCDYFQFPGVGQRKTPVANTANIFYIIGLLPGAVGQAYREDAAREMCKKYGISYDALVKTEETAIAANPTIQEATLELTINLAQAVLADSKAIKTALSQIQNTVISSAVDIKDEIKEGNTTISEDIKSLERGVAELTSKLEEIRTTSKGDRKNLSITFHCKTEEQRSQLLELAQLSGLSRSQFFLELVCKSLEVEVNG